MADLSHRRLSGRVALITGAADGLGRAITRRFAAEGAHLALIDIDEAGLAEAVEELTLLGAEVVSFAGDATDEASAVRLAGDAQACWRSIDILVNNVGGARVGRVWEMSAEDWDFTMRLNLRSLFLFSKAVLPLMMEKRSGSIICMSSGAREGTPWMAYYTGGAAYSTAKAGVHGFVRDLSMEVAQYGIRVNAIAPGPIDTPRAGPYLKQMDEMNLPYSPARMTPMGRLGLPSEIADAAVFLASDEASYITGTTLSVTGGR